MPKFKNIEDLQKRQRLNGEEKIPVSAEEYVTTGQIADLVEPHFVLTTDEASALAARDGKVYIVTQ